MMSGCTGWAPNAARSAVAESIWGPWRELGNPCEGPGAETTYDSQSTFVIAVAGTDRYIYMGDRWNPADAARRALRMAARAVRRGRIPRRVARPLALGRVTNAKPTYCI